MKKIAKALLCLAVPGLLFLNAWEGFRYSTLADQVARLEKQQKELLEANRDAIGRMAYESSPDRVAEKAAGMGLSAPAAADVTRLLVEPSGGEGR
jgi:ABC-type phosphate transport system auxiliary subunit